MTFHGYFELYFNPVQEKWNPIRQAGDYHYSSYIFYETGESEWTFLTNFRLA